MTVYNKGPPASSQGPNFRIDEIFLVKYCQQPGYEPNKFNLEIFLVKYCQQPGYEPNKFNLEIFLVKKH